MILCGSGTGEWYFASAAATFCPPLSTVLSALSNPASPASRSFIIVNGRTKNSFSTCTAAFGPALVFAFTGVGHFVETEALRQMLPPWFPWQTAVVLGSGVFELALAAGLARARTRPIAGVVAVGFLVSVAPLNVYAAWNHVGPGGHAWGPSYLWIRIPLQLVLISASYAWTVRRAPGAVSRR